MSLPRFFIESFEDETVRLHGAEARHARQVRRLKPNDAVSLFDGSGGDAVGRVVAVTRESVEIRIESRRPPQPITGTRLTIASAIPKGARAEWMVEKLAELGVGALWPLITRRSVVAPGAGRIEKWRRIAREANKQSGRSDAMEILEPVSLEIVCGRLREFDGVWLADRAGAANSPISRPARGLVVIGPEGGFDDDERAGFVDAGACPLKLTSHILRIETAAVAVGAILLSGATFEPGGGGNTPGV